MSSPTPQPPIQAEAESLEGLAAHGRLMPLFIFLESPWEEVRALKGPMTAYYSIAGVAEEREQLWHGERAIRITIAADAVESDPEICERLMALSYLDEVMVDFRPPDISFSHPRVGTFAWAASSGGDIDLLTTSRRPGAVYSMGMGYGPTAGQWRGLAQTMFGTGSTSPQDAELVYLELHAHAAFRNDIFVTTNEGCLHRRFGSAWFWSEGCASPREALTMVEEFLRSRRIYVSFIAERDRFSLGRGVFYAALAEGKLSAVFEAFRSCLAPAQVGARRITAEHLEVIISRFRTLLASHDELARLDQLEGYEFGNNGLLSEQMYHLQYAILSVAAALDALVWVIASVEGSQLDKRQIDWWKLAGISSASWIRTLRTPRAVALRDAALKHTGSGILSLAYDLRDSIQHRRPLRAGVCDLQDRPMVIGHINGPTRGKLTLVHLEQSLAPVAFRGDKEWPGIVEFAGFHYALPYRFARGLVLSLAAILNNVLGSVDWPDKDWLLANDQWRPTVDEGKRLATQAAWLFGE